MITSALGLSSLRRASKSSHVRNRRTPTRGSLTGVGTGPSKRRTIQPSSAAASASATPSLPDDRFPKKRTASIGSWVGPAVMSSRRDAPGAEKLVEFDVVPLEWVLLSDGAAAASDLTGGSPFKEGPVGRSSVLRGRFLIVGTPEETGACLSGSSGEPNADLSSRVLRSAIDTASVLPHNHRPGGGAGSASGRRGRGPRHGRGRVFEVETCTGAALWCPLGKQNGSITEKDW